MFKEEKEEKYHLRAGDEIRHEVAEAFHSIRQGWFEPRLAKNKCKVCPVSSACAEGRVKWS
ncbi:hypothetical protein KAR34_10260 [bacterium]|nr:hypothetical protein [bacterium]